METKKKKHKVLLEGPVQPSFIADSIAKHSSKTDIGAHAIFLGQVRADAKEGKAVKAIEYSAYPEMAESILSEIREDLFSRYPITCMHIYHSVGTVKAGEISLFVFVSCKHRKESFDALRDIVELLKAKVPVWKKEIYEDESHVWV
ncbi:molybdenum cofactor biosynthesis protein MoaE [Rhodocytophaga aerolata]|uniref:Molybdopterin synthase catalytic subunit n=1 Tax=Rhodocytophaga aerolata TaxID=455078 RepID=A0ABT8R5X4_9BACT|nr:molybdenum cofactor biosynthesis protein MoaE [Rhodocytophaga aerolata]MDO1447495.1 molybdenum cofactor biosynthesis protein MoaE [Rhodocytophaga aerolata]